MQTASKQHDLIYITIFNGGFGWIWFVIFVCCLASLRSQVLNLLSNPLMSSLIRSSLVGTTLKCSCPPGAKWLASVAVDVRWHLLFLLSGALEGCWCALDRFYHETRVSWTDGINKWDPAAPQPRYQYGSEPPCGMHGACIELW